MSSKSGGQEKLSCFLGVVSQETLARPVMAVAINQDGGRESGFTCMDRWCKQRDPKNDDGTPAHHEQLHFLCVESFFLYFSLSFESYTGYKQFKNRVNF